MAAEQAELDSSASCTNIKIHNFSASLLDYVVHFHVIQMRDSLFVWIGKKPQLDNLSVAMCTKYESIPAVTRLMGDVSDLTSNTLAQKLARKSKKQCFVSYNLAPVNGLLELAERTLIKEMNDKQNLF